MNTSVANDPAKAVRPSRSGIGLIQGAGDNEAARRLSIAAGLFDLRSMATWSSKAMS